MTLVSYTHNFVFLKTHKTGSSSAEMVLQPMCMDPAVIPETITLETLPFQSSHGIVCARGLGMQKMRERFPRLLIKSHLPAAHLRDDIGADVFDGALKIATIRNPFDRALSLFLTRGQMAGLITADTALDKLRTLFVDFINSDLFVDDHNICFVDNTCVIDRFLHLKTFDADMKSLFDTLGVPTPDTLHHARDNTAMRRQYSVPDFYTKPAIEQVKQRTAWMFDRFGYPETPVANAQLNSPAPKAATPAFHRSQP